MRIYSQAYHAFLQIREIFLKFFVPAKMREASNGYPCLTPIANYSFGKIFLQESKVDDSLKSIPVMGGAR